MLSVIRSRIDNHPRGLQKDIGPSEIGHPCDRWLGYKLNDTPTVTTQKDKWRPTVGTAVHSWLAKTFDAADASVVDATGKRAFIAEGRVSVGEIYPGDGNHVFGGCDLYVMGVVVDWKIVGKTTLTTVKRNKHPGAQYRTQVHSYGRGWVRARKPVEHVSVFFLPASGTLDQGYFWSEPFNEQVAVDALARVSAVNKLVGAYGNQAPTMLQATGHHCRDWCEWFRPDSKDLAVACPGVDLKPSGWAGLLPS